MPMGRFGEQVAGLTIRPGVAGVVRDAQDRILLHRRRVGGGWAPPSGSLEAGEGLHAGLRRELREETGLEVDIERLVGIYSDPAFQIVHYPDGSVIQFVTCLLPAVSGVAIFTVLAREQPGGGSLPPPCRQTSRPMPASGFGMHCLVTQT